MPAPGVTRGGGGPLKSIVYPSAAAVTQLAPSLTLAPGQAEIPGARYQTAAALLAQLATYYAAGIFPHIYFDDAAGTPSIDVPWVQNPLSRWLAGAGAAGLQFATVRIEDGITVEGLQTVGSEGSELTIDCFSSSPVFVPAAVGVTIFTMFGGILYPETGPLWRITGTDALFLIGFADAQFRDGNQAGGFLVDLQDTSQCVVTLHDTSTLDHNSIKGAVGTSLFVYPVGGAGGGLVGTTNYQLQTSMLGSINDLRVACLRSQIGGVASENATSVAFDETLQFLSTLRLDTDAAGSDLTATLPPIGTLNNQRRILVVNIGVTTFNVNVAPSGGDTIMGGAGSAIGPGGSKVYEAFVGSTDWSVF